MRTLSRGARAAVLACALFACNDGLQPVPACAAGICGRVTFQGAIPDSTQAVYVVGYHTFPHSRDSLFTFQPQPIILLQPLPLDSSTASYAVPLPTGRYEWIVAVWVKTGFTLANADSTLKEAGYSRDPADTTLPGVVTVFAQGGDSVNFVIDFDHMHRPCTYYNPPCP